jgi:hypothetical protein
MKVHTEEKWNAHLGCYIVSFYVYLGVPWFFGILRRKKVIIGSMIKDYSGDTREALLEHLKEEAEAAWKS